jgi:hypothetical protein
MKRMTPGQAFQAQNGAPYRSMEADCVIGIMGTCGKKSARGKLKGREQNLVSTDKSKQQKSDHAD